MSIEIPIGNEVAERKTGRNVRIRALFLRHGEKAFSTTSGETGLTERGRKATAEVGRNSAVGNIVKPYSSDTDRTIETASLITEACRGEKKLTLRLRDELAFNYDKEGVFLNNVMHIKQNFLQGNFEHASQDEQDDQIKKCNDAQIDYYLKYGDKRPDEETFSPVETATQVAVLIDRFIRMTEKLNDNTELDLINITHDFNLAAFLKEVLIRDVDGQKVRGFNSVSEIGGAMDFNEGFEIDITTDNERKKHIKLIFRGVNYNLDRERFDELLALAKSQGKDLNEGSI